jgi:hypothetical protein
MRSVSLPLLLLAASVTGSFAATLNAPEPERDTRRVYELRARRQLELLKLQITDAEIEARQFGEEARQKTELRVGQLRAQADEAQAELAGMQSAAQATWRTVRRRLDSSLEALRREYEGLKKDLEEKPD